MRRLIVRLSAGIALAAITVGASLSAFGQSGNQLGQTVQCQPFQTTVFMTLNGADPASTTSFRVAPRTTLAIEQIALRFDATNGPIAPIFNALTTTVRSTTSAYYVPIPFEERVVTPLRPLTLMQPVRVYADGGTDVKLFITLDTRYTDGDSGRAEWSVSGVTCSA